MITDDSLHKTWEFKGIEILPLARARKFHLSKLVDFSKISPFDIAALIFGLTCNQSVIIKGLRNPDFFNEKVSEWIESTGIEMDDFDENTLAIVKEVMEHSDSNKAIPVSDPSMMPDPMGNG